MRAAKRKAFRKSPERLLVVLLHAHLPDCRRPDLPASLEESWFFEALTGSYLPLIRMLDRLRDDAIPVRLTLGLSPTLICMLRDGELARRYRRWLEGTGRLAQHDAEYGEADLREIAAWHARFLDETHRTFDERCRGDPIQAFREHAASGRIELATTAATHAILPLHMGTPGVVQAQIRTGIDTFKDAFGTIPAFFWLPECGWSPGLETPLAAAGVRLFGVESHGVRQARPPPASGTHAPLRCSAQGTPMLVFGRDDEISRLVWSAPEGYPGHPDYREFHRDRVHELPDATLEACGIAPGARLPAGLKYWRITGSRSEKALYHPDNAAARAREHATDFIERIQQAPAGTSRGTDPVLRFAPFDAELFGHWWFEGPLWLEALFRSLARQNAITAATASEAAGRFEHPPDGVPAPSSWGPRGDHSHWINRKTDWLYPSLDTAARRFLRLHGRFRDARKNSPEMRALRQAARTLLLLQASDWPFMISSGDAADLAQNHLESLLSRFEQLSRAIETGNIPDRLIQECEAADTAFPNLNLEHFRTDEPAAI